MSTRDVFWWWTGWGAVGMALVIVPAVMFCWAISSTANYYSAKLFHPSWTQSVLASSAIPGAGMTQALARALTNQPSLESSKDWAARNEQLLHLRRQMRWVTYGWLISGMLSFVLGCGWLAVGIQRLKRL